VIKLRGPRYKSYVGKFLPPVNYAGQYLENLSRNLVLFLKRDFHMKSGMKNLIEAFYRSITEDAPPPISYRVIILTCRIMDAIFEQTSAPTHHSILPASEICLSQEFSAELT
jgi:hypothetical protein